ncbi:MAG: hypothetical protein ABII00_18000 [Elusimicrobiota bacterium]
MAGLEQAAGHERRFCKTDCRDCAFYRSCQGLATTVLVVTNDKALIRALEKHADGEKLSLRFARSGYESSAVIDAFRPAVVLMDSALAEVREGDLADSIARDDRIPGVKVLIARREGHESGLGGIAAPTITPPFTAERIERLLGELSRPGGDATRRA